MKYFLAYALLIFLFTSCNSSTKTDEQKGKYSTNNNSIPADLTCTILDESPNESLNKCNLNIQLNRKIDEKELTALAYKFRSTREKYNHLWIFYLLPGMKVNSGAWATTHFTPELEVKILGSTAKEEKKLNNSSKTVEGKIISRWFEQQYTSASLIYYKKGSKFYMKTTFKDNSSMDSEVKKKKVKNGLQLREIDNTNGEYYIIATDGNLDFYNKEGRRFTTGQVVK